MTDEESPFGYKVTEVPVRKPKKYRWKCTHCGSTNVVADFSCYWDEKLQKWIGDDDLERDWCHECQSETRLENVELRNEAND